MKCSLAWWVLGSFFFVCFRTEILTILPTCLFFFFSYFSHHSTAGTHMRCMTTFSTSHWQCAQVHPAQLGPFCRACWRKMACIGWGLGTILWVRSFYCIYPRHKFMYNIDSFFCGAPSGGWFCTHAITAAETLLIYSSDPFTWTFLKLTFCEFKIKLLCLLCFQNEISAHTFFSSINWDDLIQKKIPPPFTPKVVNVSCYF